MELSLCVSWKAHIFLNILTSNTHFDKIWSYVFVSLNPPYGYHTHNLITRINRVEVLSWGALDPRGIICTPLLWVRILERVLILIVLLKFFLSQFSLQIIPSLAGFAGICDLPVAGVHRREWMIISFHLFI